MKRRELVETQQSNSLLLALVSVGLILISFSSVSDNAIRLSSYYFVFIILLLPERLSLIKNTFKKHSMTLAIFIVFSLVYYKNLVIDGYDIVPYQSKFSHINIQKETINES
jgi:hypothetical protein